MADNIIEPDVDEQNTESIDLANKSEFSELLTPLEQRRKRKDRSITNTPSPGANKPPQPKFKELSNSQPVTAEKAPKLRAVFNNSPTGSVERVACQKLVTSNAFLVTDSTMNRNEINKRTTSKPYRCYQDKKLSQSWEWRLCNRLLHNFKAERRLGPMCPKSWEDLHPHLQAAASQLPEEGCKSSHHQRLH